MNPRRPSVGRFHEQIDDLQNRLDEIAVLFEQVSRDVSSPRDRERHDTGRISGSGVSDPTGSVIVEHEHTRALLKSAHAKLEGMNKTADGLADKLYGFYDPTQFDSLARFTTPDPEAVKTQNAARRSQEAEVKRKVRQRLEARLRKLAG